MLAADELVVDLVHVERLQVYLVESLALDHNQHGDLVSSALCTRTGGHFVNTTHTLAVLDLLWVSPMTDTRDETDFLTAFDFPLFACFTTIILHVSGEYRRNSD